MIVDCHTHIWNSPKQLGEGAEEYLARQSSQDDLPAGTADHLDAVGTVDKVLVLGFVSDFLGAEIPNGLIGRYAREHPGKIIGVAGIDPSRDGEADRAAELLEDPIFRGLTISPALQNFHPADTRAMRIYELAAQTGKPVFIHHGTHFMARGRMDFARPMLLDEIACEYPDLTLVVSSLGHPWVEEAIALLGKHKRVFADASGLIRRPWQAYNALVLCHQFNVMDKVLFGSDFPFFTPAEAIKAVYRLHEVTQGTNLPSVPREVLRNMVERNSLQSLGIARDDEQVVPAEPEPEHDVEETV